jgi:hypothetical protein
MRCYYHQEVEAVGICKSCSRGLCADCAVEVGEGLACRDRCEQGVAELNALLKRGSASHQIARGVYLRSAILYMIVGVVCFGGGAVVLPSDALFLPGCILSAFGGFVFLLGLSLLRAARSYRAK